MQTKVFLREKQLFKDVEITDSTKPEISDELLNKWGDIANIIADITGANAALIKKISKDKIKIFSKNENENSPFKLGLREPLGNGYYCETVIAQKKELYIKNALKNEAWENNPALNCDMISYYGLPLDWPDGKSFGSICILDNKPMNLNKKIKKFFNLFKKIIENDLKSLSKVQDLKIKNKAIETAIAGIIFLNMQGEIIYANDSFLKMSGQENAEEIYESKITPFDLIPETEYDKIKKAIEITIKTGEWKGESKVLKPNGKEIDIKLTSSLVKDNNEQPLCMMASIEYITEKKRAENKVKEAKKLLRNLVNKTPGAVFQHQLLLDGSYSFTYASEAIYEIYEVTAEEAKADVNKVIDRIHPDDHERITASIKKSAENLTVWEEEYRVELPEKGIRWLEGYAEPEKRPDGSVIWYGNIRDITGRKEKEKRMQQQKEKLRQQKNRLNFILEGTDTGTWEYNVQTGETTFNEKWAENIGYKLEELKPTSFETWKKHTHPEDLKKAIKNLEKHFRREIEQYDVEIRMKHKDGHWVWINARGRVISWTEDNKPLKMFGVNLDITERKKQQEKLKYQHKFQKTLAQISTDLLEINSANIDRKINHSLEKIGKFFNVDRSYIIQLSEENQSLSNTHEWCRKGVKSEQENFQKIPNSHFSWSLKQLYQNQHLNIADVDKMPKEAEAEKKAIKALGIQSLVIMPMFNENELFGFFVFDSVKNKRSFSDEAIRLLKIFTDTIINAFSKHINEKKIRNLTYKDRLTGLYNRRFFEEELERIDTKRQLPISIIVADINGLKIINDSLGHEKGDQLLIKAANILNDLTREEDILARQGGDEFAILLPKTKKETAEMIINRIKKKTDQINDKTLTVTIALGLAVKRNSNQNIEEILKEADNEMYQNKLSESRSAKSRIVKNLLNTLEVKSNETKEHAERMTKLTFKFGESLNLSNSELNRLSLLSTLHDIGKTTIAEKILKKPGGLTDAEWAVIKEHPERGYKIANSSQEFALVAEDIFAHHERWDGKGYPRKLKGKAIPYLARIISIIDAFDVMTNNRVYSKAVSKKEALAEIEICAGSQFDPELAENFIKLMTDSNLD